MMEYREQIYLYLSGLANKKEEILTENALLRDAGFLESFIKAAERRLYTAPPRLAETVMRLLPESAVKVPVLSKKLCAAVCFCSAASILLFTLSGFDRFLAEIFAAHSGKLNEIFDFAQLMTLGG